MIGEFRKKRIPRNVRVGDAGECGLFKTITELCRASLKRRGSSLLASLLPHRFRKATPEVKPKPRLICGNCLEHDGADYIDQTAEGCIGEDCRGEDFRYCQKAGYSESNRGSRAGAGIRLKPGRRNIPTEEEETKSFYRMRLSEALQILEHVVRTPGEGGLSEAADWLNENFQKRIQREDSINREDPFWNQFSGQKMVLRLKNGTTIQGKLEGEQQGFLKLADVSIIGDHGERKFRADWCAVEKTQVVLFHGVR